MAALHSKRLVPEQQGIMEVFKSLIAHGANPDRVQEGFSSERKGCFAAAFHCSAVRLAYEWKAYLTRRCS